MKSGKSSEFNKAFTDEVLPMIKAQPGFKHELGMLNGEHAIGLSVWSDKASAEEYSTAVYPKVLQKLSPWIEGTPKVTNYDLTVSTLAV